MVRGGGGGLWGAGGDMGRPWGGLGGFCGIQELGGERRVNWGCFYRGRRWEGGLGGLWVGCWGAPTLNPIRGSLWGVVRSLWGDTGGDLVWDAPFWGPVGGMGCPLPHEGSLWGIMGGGGGSGGLHMGMGGFGDSLWGVPLWGPMGGEGNFSAPSLISYGEVLGGGEPNGVPHYRDPMGRGTLELSISTGMGNSGVTHRVSYWGGGGIWGAPFPLPYGFREQWGAPEENIIG